MYFYNKNYPFLQHGGWSSVHIHPTLGLRQGDPLSPTMINFLMDQMLQQIPEKVGVHVN